VAVAVIRDNIRPPIPAGAPPEYAQLVADCWHVDPTIRPTFLEVMNRLVTMSGSSLTQSSHSSTASSSSITSGPKDHLASWTVRTGRSSDTSSDYGSGSSKSDPKVGRLDGAAEHAPRGEVAIVFSDITCSATLWEFDPSAMRDATILHNEIARDALKRHSGYEVVAFSKDSYRNSGEGSFCLAFQHIEDALEWCMDVQAALLHASWPESLLKHPGAAEEGDERYCFSSLLAQALDMEEKADCLLRSSLFFLLRSSVLAQNAIQRPAGPNGRGGGKCEDGEGSDDPTPGISGAGGQPRSVPDVAEPRRTGPPLRGRPRKGPRNAAGQGEKAHHRAGDD
jgi:hypothetical protein